MSVPVRARRLSPDEGQYLLRLVRRGRQESIRVRRGLMILASSSGTPVPAIARLVAADEDTVRDVIHAFNQRGLAALDPHWAGGAPRRISDDDVAFILATATTRPKKLGLPFTHFSIRKLAGYLQGRYGHRDSRRVPARQISIRRERLRQILAGHDITFQRTRTWKESTDPDYESKLDRIEQVTTRFLPRCFAFDQFGPLSIRPCHGTCWAARNHPDRLRATYKRTHGIRYLHGCYDLVRWPRTFAGLWSSSLARRTLLLFEQELVTRAKGRIPSQRTPPSPGQDRKIIQVSGNAVRHLAIAYLAGSGQRGSVKLTADLGC